jgi:hypothetical protein
MYASHAPPRDVWRCCKWVTTGAFWVHASAVRKRWTSNRALAAAAHRLEGQQQQQQAAPPKREPVSPWLAIVMRVSVPLYECCC